MATTYSDDVYNVYSIYRATYPITEINKEEEESILVLISNSLKNKAATTRNGNLDKIIQYYYLTKNEVDGKISAKTGGFAADISSRVTSFFRVGFTSMWSGFWDNVKTFFGTSIPSLWTGFVEWDEKGFENIMSSFVSAGFVSQESADYLLSIFAQSKTFSGIAPVLIMIGVVFTLIFSGTGIMMGDFVKKLNSKYTPNSIPPADLIRALHIAPEKAEQINTKLKENGLDDSDIEIAKLSSYQMLDIDTIRQVFLRKVISKDEAVNRLAELGFTPKRIVEIMSTWNIIPSPQDLFWMVGHEAFEEDQVRDFGLDAEFPTEQVKWLEQQGYSEYWSRKYWRAHWDYPSEGRVLDLFHRGLITKHEMEQFYRVIEITPYWRDKLMQASYSLYTRIDLRRMHDLGIINEDQVYQNFLGEGYDAEHARNMTNFYIKYNDLNDKELSLSQVKQAYEADLITKKSAKDALVRMQYSGDQADFILEYTDYEEDIKIQKLRIKSIAKTFKDGTYTEAKTRSMLSALGVEPKWVGIYITQWTEESVHEEKLPDKSEVFAWFSNKVIDMATAYGYLRKMGYSDKTVAIYLALNSPGKA